MNGAACGSGHLYSNHGFGVVAGVYRNEPVSDVASWNRSEVADAMPVLDTQANSHALSLIFRFVFWTHRIPVMMSHPFVILFIPSKRVPIQYLK